MKMNMAQKVLLIIGGAFADRRSADNDIRSIGMVFRPTGISGIAAVFPDTGHLFYRSSIIRAA